MKNLIPLRWLLPIVLLLTATSCNHEFFALTGPSTRVVFNQPVDKRYAWLGNDAEVIDYQTEILNVINGANTSIEVSTMTFSKTEIADALVAKANAGVNVRIIGNGGHRLTQDGWKIALQGRLDMVDNNLPALVHRINFQADVGAPPAGWIADRGEAFGNHGAGTDYGWSVNQTANMVSAGVYQSPILDDSYQRLNTSGPQTWEITVPNGPYYIACMTGHPSNATRTYIKVEGQNILNAGAFSFANKSSGFWGEGVDGGVEIVPGEPPALNAVRIMVNDGRLSLTVGDPASAAIGTSALCFIEIYRGDALTTGDNTYDDGIDNTIQDRQTVHAKYIIADAGTPNATIWMSSGNLTQGMDAVSNNSEDAIISKDAALIDAFRVMFDQMWGASTGNPPSPATSNFGTYKSGTSSDFTIDGFPWKLRFSPSIGATDMATIVNDYINGSSKDLTLIQEQFTTSGGSRGFTGPNSIIININSKLSANYRMRAVIGSTTSVNSSDFPGSFDQIEIPAAGEMKIHNKYALVDAIRDTRTTLQGKLLCGSMNWTQSALHFNDEQTLVIQNPYVANQYLQHAMKRLGEQGIAPAFSTDIVLVIDRSGSMNAPSLDPGVTKIEAAKHAADLFLDIIDAGGSHRLSMVRFGTINEPFVPATALTTYNAAKRTECHTGIAGTLASSPIGNATCYNAALDEVLVQMNAVTPNERRIVHFFTDGKENCAINSSTFYGALQSRNIEVHSTGFGADTDMSASLEGLANATGGTYAQVDLVPLNLNKRFAEVARNAMNLSTVLDPNYELKPGQSVEVKFFLDKATSTAKVIASWGNSLKDPYSNFYLIAPGGKRIDRKTPGVEWNTGPGYTIISLTEKSQIEFLGTWLLTFQRSNENPQVLLPLDLMVFADGNIFFMAECLPDLIGKKDHLVAARMLYENEPVKDLRVRAEIRQPFGREYGIPKTKTINLLDDGAHHDKLKADGLFAEMFSTAAPGNYQVHVIAEGIIKTSEGESEVRREATVNFQVKGKEKDSGKD